MKFCKTPPVAFRVIVPSPTTVSPFEPVLVSRIAFGTVFNPLASMLVKVMPPAPIVVLTMSIAPPPVAEIVLVVPPTFSVPALLSLRASLAPVVTSRLSKVNVAEALEAIDLARRHFPRFSFDLIYARPAQSLQAWQTELRQALKEGVDHLSLYQLTIEENTVFHGAWRRGELEVPA